MESLSKAEANFIIAAVDCYNRAQGVNVAAMSVVICKKAHARIQVIDQQSAAVPVAAMPAVAEPAKAEEVEG